MNFAFPSSAILFSPSFGGKSSAVLKIIAEKERFFSVKIDEILYYYGIWDEEKFSNAPNIQFIKGIPAEIPKDNLKRIIVIDDQLSDKRAISRAVEIFCREAHHRNAFCFLLLQDIFYSRQLRTCSLNCKYFFLFASNRCVTSVNHLFQQLNFETRFLKDIYKEATEKRFSFLVVCVEKGFSEQLRFVTNIFRKHPRFFVKAGTYKNSPIPVTFNE
jgi:hypothetical protein